MACYCRQLASLPILLSNAKKFCYIVSNTFTFQEKTKKIYDIWVKGNTFPSAVLSQLAEVLKGPAEGAYHFFTRSMSSFLLVQSNICHSSINMRTEIMSNSLC